MDWNETLLGLVGLSAAILALRVLTQRPVPRGWLAVLLLMATVLLVGWWAFPRRVGYVSLGVWLLLVVLPSVFQRQALQWASTRWSQPARYLARVATVLHPADGWPSTRRLVEAIAALQQGRAEEAHALLQQLRMRGSSLSQAALAVQMRQSGDWTGYLQWVETHRQRDAVLADGYLLDVYLQALGETGQRGRMVLEFGESELARGHAPAQMHVAALCGDRSTTELVLDGALSRWPVEAIEFWRASAAQVSGDPDVTAVFTRLASSNNLLAANPAQRRLIDPLTPIASGELDAEGQAVLDALQSDVGHDARFAVLSSTPKRLPLVTYVIALLMTINFARELPHGSEDPEQLIELGAIVIPRHPPLYAPWLPSYDEWWRPITAAFLHFGWPHFLMNLCGVLYLGSKLERAWGGWRTLLCYSLAVAVSMVVTPWWLERTATEPQILAGASGGIMGLLGGLLGHLLIGRWRRATPQVTRQLRVLLGFVLLQTTFDLAVEQVSQEAHLLGLATGVLCGLASGLLPVRKPADI